MILAMRIKDPKTGEIRGKPEIFEFPSESIARKAVKEINQKLESQGLVLEVLEHDVPNPKHKAR